MIDAHCHLEQNDFASDLDEVIKRAKQNGLKAVITCCAHPKDLERSLEIVEKFEGYVFLTASVHPIHVPEFSDGQILEFLERLKELAKSGKIVGIGETGLDYYWVKDAEQRERQKEAFRWHIELAKKLRLPLIVHSREANEETVKILNESGHEKVLWHFFGDKNLVEWLVAKNYKASFNTLLLRSKTHKKIVKKLPLEEILLETDSPWLGFGKRNEPSAIVRVAEKIAEVKKLDFEEVWQTCGKNAKEFFDLKIKI